MKTPEAVIIYMGAKNTDIFKKHILPAVSQRGYDGA